MSPEKSKAKNLFDPVLIGGLKLKNRIVMAPMTRARALNSMPNDLMATYYSQRATAGLIITEGTSPSPNGLGYARIPGIYNGDQIEGWKKVTRAVHEKGGKIFVQLMHVGRIAHQDNMPANAEVLAPSAISADVDMWTDANGMQKTGVPDAMTIDGIRHAFKEFVDAALNAMKAGFDGVEIHAANGYLIEQFLNPNSNNRNDAYGGNIERRSKFLLDLTKLVIAAIGKEKVGVRLSPYSTFNSMPNYPAIPATYDYLSKELRALDVLYIHLIDYAARTSSEGLGLIKIIRKNFSNTLIFNGGYDRTRAEQSLLNEGADLISFGSKFISNPDLPYRLKNNIPLTEANSSTFYTPDSIGYSDYQYAEVEKMNL